MRNTALALQLLTQFLQAASNIGSALSKAQAEGNRDVTREEIRAAFSEDDVVRDKFQNFIDSMQS